MPEELLAALAPRVIAMLQPPLEYLTRALPRALTAALIMPQTLAETGDPRTAARRAVECADALIAELQPRGLPGQR